MAQTTFDVVVVGAGPAGSTAALVLARGGARVALVDKATFSRDKACGDLVGPRALALLTTLGLTPPAGPQVGEMIVVGPTGRRVLLPARAGRTYPDHAMAVTRVRFDSWLRDAAIAEGAEPVTGRVADAARGNRRARRWASTRRRCGDRCRRRHEQGRGSRRTGRSGGGVVGLRPAGLRRPRRRAPDHRPVGRATVAGVPRLRLAVPGRGGQRQRRPRTRLARRPILGALARSTASTPSVPTCAGSAC